MKQRNKAMLLALSLVLLGALGVQGTLALLTTSTDALPNTFTPTKVPNQVVETLENGVKKDVKIQNTGNIDAYIRAAVVVNWVDEAGNVYAIAPKVNQDYEIVFDLENGWFLGSDGFYYYSKSVKPKDLTSVLIASCQMASGAAQPEGYSLSVQIMGQSIQAKGGSVGTDGLYVPAVTQAWGISVNENGDLIAPMTGGGQG